MEKRLMLPLTKEQKAILYLWFGHKRSCFPWDANDFIDGIINVLRFYPDHRYVYAPRESSVFAQFLESDDNIYEDLVQIAQDDEEDRLITPIKPNLSFCFQGLQSQPIQMNLDEDLPF